MADVYVAEMELARAVRRRVALKRIHLHLAEDPHFLTMFLDEARLASQLAHPGVVSVHDVVENEGEILLVLDYVPGWDLASVLRASADKGMPVPFGVCVVVAQSVAETLAYVHGARDHAGNALCIVHRDVNPSNILVAEDGSVRLLDFGVAKAAERATQTATRSIKGKLAYLAPEQASSGQVDGRTDLYGLGLVLYEMVSGRRALGGGGDLALLEMARNPDFLPVSDDRDVPAPLVELIGALLAVDPNDRPSPADEVASALESLRAVITGATAEQVRGFVTLVLGTPSRPVRHGRARLDSALAKVAGVNLAAGGTAQLPKVGAWGAKAGWGAAPGSAAEGAPVGDSEWVDRARADAAAGDEVEGSWGAAASAFADTEPGHIDRSPVAEPVSRQSADEDEPFDILGAPTELESRGQRQMHTDIAPRANAAMEPTVTPVLAGRRRLGLPVGLAAIGLMALGAVLVSQRQAPAPAEDNVAAAQAFLRITSAPPGATISVDGHQLADRTPAVIAAAVGRRQQVAVSLPDHVATATTVLAAAGETRRVHVVLTRLGGRLAIRSEPGGAAVAIDGVDRGATPIVLDDLSRRAHEIVVSQRGYRTERRTVDLATLASAELDVTLERHVLTGTLDVSSTPWAKVKIDGHLVAESTPLIGHRLPVGTHSVVLENPRLGKTAKRKVVIRRGKKSSLIVRLQ